MWIPARHTQEAMMKTWPGKPYPLGATWDGDGVNFAVYSQHGTKVELCLFETAGSQTESVCLELPTCTGPVWHVYVPGLQPGQLYGFRVDGPYEPGAGHRFNRNKVLLDPYARGIGRELVWHDSLFGFVADQDDTTFDTRDSAAYAPLSVVISDAFAWGDDTPPRRPWNETLLYEVHVAGATRRYSKIAEDRRGTYAGLASMPFVRHLVSLGVTAVELLPVHHFVQDQFLVKRGLTQYWGYNTLGFFAPAPQLACATRPQDIVREFKQMVRTLHRHGIEVILDVVYNHTAEGNEYGPTICFRGLDNAGYYRLSSQAARACENFSGCGNTWNVQNRYALQLILDSMRYWVEEMHVDGFRFDLASVLGREPWDFNADAAFFDAVQQDPVLSRIKLIAEPWDAAGSFNLGQFPVPWREWNGRFRDTLREFWKGDSGRMQEFATRFCGSSDFYQQANRSPLASINLITAHDGFTLRDVVTYEHRHNEANLEVSGEEHNRSCNYGQEGESSSPELRQLRDRQRRNLLVSLLFSQGVPMLLAGDETGRTQSGNNNAYCQDNQISWLDWNPDSDQRDFLKFTKKVISLRRGHPVFRRQTFFRHPMTGLDDDRDIHWLTPEGTPMQPGDWQAPYARCLGILLDGQMKDELDAQGRPVVGETVLLLINASDGDILFELPELPEIDCWEVELDTFFPKRRPKRVEENGISYRLHDHSVAFLVRRQKNRERLRRTPRGTHRH